MDGKIKILIISHALVSDVNQKRWERLAKDNNYEVNLLIPKYWESNWFKEKIIYEPKEIRSKDYNIYTLNTTSKSKWTRYFFKSYSLKLNKIKPDLIYIIQEESIWVHHQIYLARKFFAPKAKIIFFSMNALGMTYEKTNNVLFKVILKLMWNNIKRNTEAALVHYPGCMDSLRKGGYNKPIYLQTQIGVDETLFTTSNDVREEYRKKLKYNSKFVIGYSGRLTAAKGVDDLFEVFCRLSKEHEDIALLLVGNGDLKESIEKGVIQLNLQNRVHITGFVDQSEVPKYMNAMDCFVLGSKTTANWIDTFPLVTVQAQACGLPVIASDSGSIPWQLDNSAIIYSEGNREELSRAIVEFVECDNLRIKYAQIGQKRSYEYFCHGGMTQNFKKIVEQIMEHNYFYHNKEEEYKQWKAY